MSDLGGNIWGILLGSNAVTGALAYLIPAFVTRKKDAGELANDMLAKALERIEKLESDSADCHRANLALTMRCERNEMVLQLAINDLHARAPDSPVLAQARTLLNRAFPIPRDFPPDMYARLDEIDQKTF